MNICESRVYGIKYEDNGKNLRIKMSFNITKQQYCSAGKKENSNTFRVPISITCTERNTQL